jgi:hypothetical protein
MPNIVAVGVLTPAHKGVADHERKALWFTQSEKFPPTAKKVIRVAGRPRAATLDEMDRIGGGIYRVGVGDDIAPIGWTEFKRISGISAKSASALARVAIKDHEKPSQWRVSFDGVPRSEWLTVERLELATKTWQKMSNEEIDALAGPEGPRPFPKAQIVETTAPVDGELFPSVAFVEIDEVFKPDWSVLDPASDPRPMLHSAQIITVLDRTTKKEDIAYGIETLRRESPTSPRIRVVRIRLNSESNDLEKAIALVTLIKGIEDYTRRGAEE